MSNYKDLLVWQRAMDLSAALHEIARGFPRHIGVPGLRAQLLRAAGSIHANIAEGSDASNADFARFVTVSIGSANETESHLIHATRVGLLDKRRSDELLSNVEEIRRMLPPTSGGSPTFRPCHGTTGRSTLARSSDARVGECTCCM